MLLCNGKNLENNGFPIILKFSLCYHYTHIVNLGGVNIYKGILIILFSFFIIACSADSDEPQNPSEVEGIGSSSTWEAEILNESEAGERIYTMEVRFKEDTSKLLSYEIDMNGYRSSGSPGNNPTPHAIRFNDIELENFYEFNIVWGDDEGNEHLESFRIDIEEL
ncbi:hypothetical protein DH09_00825 (plasmid) [Bacillaceae bacterium JMAK1]|nr:hypothetical protein DH09_00825 [Bacillaceae bacterium JMAK1]